MPGHDVLANLGGVAGEFPDIVDLDNVTAAATLDFEGKGVARVTSTLTTGTIVLPDSGFVCVFRQQGAGPFGGGRRNFDGILHGMDNYKYRCVDAGRRYDPWAAQKNPAHC